MFCAYQHANPRNNHEDTSGGCEKRRGWLVIFDFWISPLLLHLSLAFFNSYFPSFSFLAGFGIIYKAPTARLTQFCRSQLSFFQVHLFCFSLFWGETVNTNLNTKKTPQRGQNKRMNTKAIIWKQDLKTFRSLFIIWRIFFSLGVSAFL